MPVWTPLSPLGRDVPAYVAICSASWTGAMFLWTTPLLVPAMQRAFGLSLTGAGETVTALLTCGGLGVLIANLLVRRLPLTLIAATGGALILGGLVLLGAGAPGSNPALLAGVAGAGAGLVLSVVDPAAARLPAPERPLAFAGVTNTLIAASAFALIPALMDRFGPSWIFWSHALMAALALPVLLIALSRSRPARAAQRPGFSGRRAPAAAAALAGYGVYILGMGSYWALLEAGGRGAGLTPAQTGEVAALATILSLAAPAAAAFMGARYGRLWPLTLGTALFGASAAATLTAKTPFAFGFALTLASAWIVFVPGFVGGVLIGLDRSGRTANLANASMFFLNGAGPSVGAFLAARFGLEGLAASTFGLCLVSALLYVWPARLVDLADAQGRRGAGRAGPQTTIAVAAQLLGRRDARATTQSGDHHAGKSSADVAPAPLFRRA